jgi:hypothetical protein
VLWLLMGFEETGVQAERFSIVAPQSGESLIIRCQGCESLMVNTRLHRGKSSPSGRGAGRGMCAVLGYHA